MTAARERAKELRRAIDEGQDPLAAAPSPTPLIKVTGIPLLTSIPPSACIPPLRPCSALITARVYACVGLQGGRVHGQAYEIE
jgi:hypothetical protein